MKKLTILCAPILIMALSPLTASAESDSQYPAANFEPKVIFTDESVAKSAKSSAESSHTASHAKKHEVDPDHPAAFFEPKVIFP